MARVGIFVVASTSPYFFSKVIEQYFKDQIKIRRTAKKRTLLELEKRKYISFEERSGGSLEIKLTHRGRMFVRKYKIDTMELDRTKEWDGKWRVLLYDIPTRYKNASDAFREKLKQLGVYQLQKSVWVSPHDFHAEIEFLCGVFGININKYILYFTTSQIPKEKILKNFFVLS